MGSVVFPPVPDAPPDHESPLVPVAVHEDVLDTFQYTRAVSPGRTRDGRAWRWPLAVNAMPFPSVALNEVKPGAGGGTQAPALHWYEQDWTTAPVQLLVTLSPEQTLVGAQTYVMVFEAFVVPPAPVQETVYVVVCAGVT